MRLLLLFALCSSPVLADNVAYVTILMDSVEPMTFIVPASFPNDPGLQDGNGEHGVTGNMAGLVFTCPTGTFIDGYGECNPDAFYPSDFQSSPFLSLSNGVASFIAGDHTSPRGQTIDIIIADPPTMPEPATALLLLLGSLAIVPMAKHKRHKLAEHESQHESTT